MKKRNIFKVIIFFFVFVTLSKSVGAEKTQIARAVDGNTVILGNGEKLHYIGVIIPNRGASFLEEAKDYNSHLVTFQKAGYGGVVGVEAVIEYDIQLRNSKKELQGYVFASHLFVNAAIITEGYGIVRSFSPDLKHQKLLNKAQVHAREMKAGIWADITPYDGPFIGSKHTKIFYRKNSEKANSIPAAEQETLSSFEEALERGYDINPQYLP